MGEKVFNDPIHGHIDLHPVCVAIIDTPQFQRLKDLRQLGPLYDVFPGASHNRFEHCLGVSYLAGVMVEQIRSRQDDLGITDVDVLCVKLAGLCHDLGHGPMSHMFDGHFIRHIRPDCGWDHEHASASLLDYLIDDNSLWPTLAAHGLVEADITFIKELIFGGPSGAPAGWVWTGRGVAKAFLFEIVANKRNGIDVDKFDYFARDCHQLGMKWSFDALRLMRFCRVLTVDGSPQICYHEKEAWNIYELFHTRYSLHKRAYQHRVGTVIGRMYTDALLAANDAVKIPASASVSEPGCRFVRMSEAIDHPAAYARLTDSVVRSIEYSTDPALAEARAILHRIRRRELYGFVGETLVPPHVSTPIIPADVIADIVATVLDDTSPFSPLTSPIRSPKSSFPQQWEWFMGPCPTVIPEAFTPDNLIVDIVTISYGKGRFNPVDSVRFYSRDDVEGCVMPREKVSALLPQVFEEKYVRVYTRDRSLIDAARYGFEKWCEKVVKQAPIPTASPKKRPRVSHVSESLGARSSLTFLSQP